MCGTVLESFQIYQVKRFHPRHSKVLVHQSEGFVEFLVPNVVNTARVLVKLGGD